MSYFFPKALQDLLDDLDAQSLTWRADGEALCYGPVERATPDLVARIKAFKPELLALVSPPKAAPALSEAWFGAGTFAPSRLIFAYDPETRTRPGWWDYLYELHNRGGTVVNGRVVRKSPEDPRSEARERGPATGTQ